MLRPKKRQKFAGFKLPGEPPRVVPVAKPEEDQPDVHAEGDKAEEKELVHKADPDLNGSKKAKLQQAAKSSLISLLSAVEVAGEEDDLEAAFEPFNAEREREGTDDQELVGLLLEATAKIFPDRKVELVPFGSFVTDLRLPGWPVSLDASLVFPDCPTDPTEAEDALKEVILPALEKLLVFLRMNGAVIKETVRKAPVPHVVFESKKVLVHVYIQHTYGVLGTWHARDLCKGGWPGRLRALYTLVKAWAKSKNILGEKETGLGSYAYFLLCTSFLQELGAVPALLPWTAAGPYVEGEDAQRQVLDLHQTEGDACDLWRGSELTGPDFSDAAGWQPTQFLVSWLDWMWETVLGFAQGAETGKVGRTPLDERHIVSARERSQEELREDVALSPRPDEQWSPAKKEVFLLVEDPISGENVARTVTLKGFTCIWNEVKRSRKFYESPEHLDTKIKTFKELLVVTPLMGTVSSPAALAGMFGMAGRPPPRAPGPLAALRP